MDYEKGWKCLKSALKNALFMEDVSLVKNKDNGATEMAETVLRLMKSYEKLEEEYGEGK